MYWLRLYAPLWPAVVVWLCICYPMLAWSSSEVRQAWPRLPLLLRVLLWLVEHVWPYSRIAEFGATLHAAEAERRAQQRASRCPVCLRNSMSIEHALTHTLVDEDAEWDRIWWRPPVLQSPAEAEAWLAARQATGGPSLA